MTSEKFDYKKWGARPSKIANKPTESFDYEKWGARAFKKKEEKPEDEGYSFFSPEQRSASAFKNPTEQLLKATEINTPEYQKGLWQSAINSAANQSIALNNLLGANLPYYHDLNKPATESEQIGQNVGGSLLGLIPGGAAFKTAGLISRAPEEATLLAKMLRASGRTALGSAAGGLTKAATSEERQKGGLEGLVEGGLSVAVPGAASAIANKFGRKGITKAQQAIEQALEQEQKAKQALEMTKAQAQELKLPSNVERYPLRHEANEQAIKALLEEHEGLPKEEFPTTVLHPAHTQLVPRAEQRVSDINQQIAAELGQGLPNDERLAQIIAHTFEGRPVQTPQGMRRVGGLKQELGKEFQAIDTLFEGKKVNIPKEITEEDAKKLAPEFLGEDANPIAYRSFIEHAKDYLKDMAGHKIEDAQTLYRKYRTLTMESNRVRGTLSDKGLTPEEFARRKGIVAAHEAEAKQIENILDKQVGGPAFKRLQQVKKRWAEEYAPLSELKHYKNMVEHERINTSNLPSELRGAHPGNVILRNFIQSHPEAARLTSAMQFAQNPERLANPSQTEASYINPQLNPRLHELQQQQQQAIANIERARAQQAHFTELHERISQEAKLHAEQMERAKKIEEQIPKLQEENINLEKYEKLIRKQLENKNLTKTQRETKQQHYDLIVKQQKANATTIKNIAKALAGMAALSSLVKK